MYYVYMYIYKYHHPNLCIRMYSYASITHAYAPINFHTKSLPSPSITLPNGNLQHTCSQKGKSRTSVNIEKLKSVA